MLGNVVCGLVHDMLWCGVKWCDVVSIVWCGFIVWCGMVWYGMVSHGMAWYGMV